MGKASLKKKRASGGGGGGGKPASLERSGSSSKVLDGDETIFTDMAQEHKEEGNKLFQRRDYDRALLNYDKAIKLLPRAHPDVAYLHSNIAACYMQMSPPDYYRAINECNVALEASPKYTKALLKRARCFEALGRLDLACRDVNKVLALEPNNLTALDVADRVKNAMEEKGIVLDEKEVMPTPEEVVAAAPKQKPRKKRGGRKAAAKAAAAAVEEVEEQKIAEAVKEDVEEPPRQVKLVFGEDIRWAQVPASCSMAQLREAVRSKFPGLKAVLVKYKDKEGDLVTITNQDELKWAEQLADPGSSLRLYVTEANPEHEPYIDDSNSGPMERNVNSASENGSIRSNRQDEDRSTVTCIDDWIVQFARLFKNHVGVSSDEYLDLHEVSMKLYTEAIEDTITTDEAQEVFQLAERNFQEMAALAFFHWGNVHMSRARKRLLLSGDAPRELVLEQVKEAYEWAREEYNKAGKTYEEAVKAKPDFFEGFLALAHQQFEQAKLSWYYAVGSNLDLETCSTEILELFNKAEDNIEKGIEMWEEMEEQRLKNRSKPSQENVVLEKMGLEEYIKDVSTDDAAEQASNLRSQINILWGMLLYERSVVEFKLGLPMWEDCLMSAIEKFKLGGASATDIAVLVKNHCANETAQDGLVFKIEEIVQAWNEMYDIRDTIDKQEEEEGDAAKNKRKQDSGSDGDGGNGSGSEEGEQNKRMRREERRRQAKGKAVAPQIDTGMFSSIPPELFLQIFKFLSSEDLISCALVCRFMNAAASDETLWRRLYCMRWGLASNAKFRECAWKNLYIQRDREDMVEFVRNTPTEFREYYIQMQASKRSQAPLPSEVNDDKVILDKTIADQVSTWKSSRGLTDESVKGHSCSGNTCSYTQIGDAYICEKTGRVHVCDDACREFVLDQSSGLLLCTISGHCFERWLCPDDEWDADDTQQGGVVDEPEPFMGSGRFARAIMLGYNCTDEKELEQALRFC